MIRLEIHEKFLGGKEETLSTFCHPKNETFTFFSKENSYLVVV